VTAAVSFLAREVDRLIAEEQRTTPRPVARSA